MAAAATSEEAWKALALKLVGVVVEYDKLVIDLHGDEIPKTKDKLQYLRKLVEILRDQHDPLNEVLFIPSYINKNR